MNEQELQVWSRVYAAAFAAYFEGVEHVDRAFPPAVEFARHSADVAVGEYRRAADELSNSRNKF